MRTRRLFGRATLALAVLGASSCSSVAPREKAVEPDVSEARAGGAGRVPQSCLDAVRRLLGPRAEIVKYGGLNGPSVLEAVAIQRLGKPGRGDEAIPISRLIILRLEASAWKLILDVSENKTNEAGYVGIDYIDDSYEFHGYQLLLADHSSDGEVGFTVELIYLNAGGVPEGAPIEIAWNSKVGRYQEYAANEDPVGFKPESKNPPHIRTGGNKGLVVQSPTPR